MKTIILVNKPGGSDITLEETLQQWEQIKTVPGIEPVIKVRKERLSTEEWSAIIDSDAEAVLGVFLKKDLITEEFFHSHPKIRYMAGFAHGYEEFDIELTKRHGVTITNTAYGAATIAEFAFALLLDICHKVGVHDHYVKSHDWANDKTPKFMFGLTPQIELNGLTMGIIGLGKIGYHTALIAKGFGMNVISYSRHKKEGAEYDFIRQVSLEELYRQADVISLHTPLTHATKHMINAESIAKMKDGVILINTSRGGLIDENALVAALNSGKVYAAGLDVISEEPPRSNLPIFSAKNVTITDHIAYLPKSSRLRAVDVAIENYRNFLEGHPTSVINR